MRTATSQSNDGTRKTYLKRSRGGEKSPNRSFALNESKPENGTKMTDVNMNADGSMRINKKFESEGRVYTTTMTLSDCIVMNVESCNTEMSLFDDVSDTKEFPMGSFCEAWGWAVNTVADFQFRKR